MQIPIVSDILDAIQKFANWVWSEAKWIYGAIVAFIMVPVNYFLDWVHGLLTGFLVKWAVVDQAVDSLGINDMGSMWSSAGGMLAMANTVFPVNFCVTLFAALAVLWIACALIRLIIRVVTVGLG